MSLNWIITYEYIPILHDIMFIISCSAVLSLMIQCCGMRLSYVGCWCDATLFSALRSSDFCLNIHRDESPVSSHTLWMGLCFAGQQRRLKGPGPVVGLFVYCALKFATKYIKHINSVNMLTVCWLFYMACKVEFPGIHWGSIQITGHIADQKTENIHGWCSYEATKTSNRQFTIKSILLQ